VSTFKRVTLGWILECHPNTWSRRKPWPGLKR
jgi:hypothetical protein